MGGERWFDLWTKVSADCAALRKELAEAKHALAFDFDALDGRDKKMLELSTALEAANDRIAELQKDHRDYEDMIESRDKLIDEEIARAERAEAECKALRQNFATYLVPAYKADPLKVARTCDEQLDQSGALLGYVRDIARAALNPSPAEKSPT